jgi:mono/diheme cytochrome c family protein
LEKRFLAALVLGAILAVAVGAYWALEPGHKDDVSETVAGKTLDRGALVYIESCASCHGTYGEGSTDGPPVRGTQRSLAEIRRAIEQGTRAFPSTYHVYGRKGGGPLSDAQVDDLTFFIMNWDTQAVERARSAPAAVVTELTDEGMEPAELEMKAGERVRLVVANFAGADSVCRGDGLLGRMLAEDGTEETEQEVALEVAGGQTEALEFTPINPGSYRFSCVPLEAGLAVLEGTITVVR